MRCLLRILLKAATLLALVLCVATVVLWMRSYWRTDSITVIAPGEVEQPGDHGQIRRSLVACSSRGSLWFQRWDEETRWRDGDGVPTPPTFSVSMSHSPRPLSIESGMRGTFRAGPAGFAQGTEEYRGSGASSELAYFAVPHWWPALALAILALPAIRMFRIRRRAGLCPACGYDLRATPDRCPECGREANRA